jgi:predicted N-formylglutamate amidohydrolase
VVKRGYRFIVTCEHGGNRVPARYSARFTGWEHRLESHRGFDAGALSMAHDLARAVGAPLVASRVTRLLVDLNRSIGHPQLHSRALRGVSPDEIQRILDEHYTPYRRRVERLVARGAEGGRRVVHISSHSFTPRLAGEVRRADIGLLYDPSRPGERALARHWKSAIHDCNPGLRVRRNYPYEGKNDGLTSYLRQRYGPRSYVGVELEINQAIARRGGRSWTRLRKTLVRALLGAIDEKHEPLPGPIRAALFAPQSGQ